MRFVITAQPGTSEPRPAADAPLDEALFAAYMKYNEDMAKAGVLVTAAGLLPDGARARVAVSGGKRTVVDGPFTESKELLGGFNVIEVKSRQEAIEWALRCPVGLGTDEVLEIKQMTELADIPPKLQEIIRSVAPTWSASFTGGR
jgi:hypothetical protein